MVNNKLSAYEKDLVKQCKKIINSLDKRKKESIDVGYHMYCTGFLDAIYKTLPFVSQEVFEEVDNYYAKKILGLDVYKHLKQSKNVGVNNDN